MELKKIACPKCGGFVKLDDNLSGGGCPSCGFKFAVGADAPLFTEPKKENGRGNNPTPAAPEKAVAPAKNNDVERRLSMAFGALNRRQWLRAGSQFDDILKMDPNNGEALRGKRLIAEHKTDAPEPEPEKVPAPVEAPAPKAEEEKVPEEPIAPAPVAVEVAPEETVEEAPVEEIPAEDTLAVDTPAEPEIVPVTPVINPDPESESGRKTESQIANTDRKIVARLSDTVNRKKNQKLLTKSNKALKKGKWKKANSLADQILETDPESAYAFRNKLLAELKLTEERRLAEYSGNLTDHRFFLLALNYSSGSLNRRLTSYADASTRAALAVERNRAVREMERLRKSEGIIDRTVAEVNASLPENYTDEKSEKERNKQISKILDKADSARERKSWKKADGLYHDALAVDGECADAYLGLLLVSLKLKQEKKLAHCKEPYGTDPNFLLAMHYGSRVMRRRLERYLASAGQMTAEASSGLAVPVAVSKKEEMVAPVPVVVSDNAEIKELREEMNSRLDRIEEMISGVTPVAVPSDPKEIAERLAAAEREVALTRVNAAEASARNAKTTSEERAEMEARLHAKELEVVRLRAAMKDADAALSGDYFSVELRDTAKQLNPIFERADKLLKKGKFGKARDQYDEVLELDPTNGRAYIGKLLCELSVRYEKNLDKVKTSYSMNENFVLAVRFSTPEVAKRLQKASDTVDRKLGILSEEKTGKAAKRDSKKKERVSAARRNLLVSDAEEKVKNAEISGTYLKRSEIEDLAKTADNFISRGKFERASVPVNRLKAGAPGSCEGYIYGLLCTMQCKKLSELGKARHSFRENPDFILASRFCSKKTRRQLKKYADKADARAKKAGESLENEYALMYENEKIGELSEKNTLYRDIGDYAERRRVGNDMYAVKAAAADATRISAAHAEKHKKALKTGYKLLKRGKWEKADAYFEEVRAEDPANCSAYIGKLLVSLSLYEEKDLGKTKKQFGENRYYILALCCADGETAERLRKYCEHASRGVKAKTNETPKSATDLAKRRDESNRKTIEQLQKRNRELEEQLAMRDLRNSKVSSFSDDEDYVLHEGKFSSLKVFLFLLGMVVVFAVIAGAVLLVGKYHGSPSAMIDAFKSLKK